MSFVHGFRKANESKLSKWKEWSMFVCVMSYPLKTINSRLFNKLNALLDSLPLFLQFKAAAAIEMIYIYIWSCNLQRIYANEYSIKRYNFFRKDHKEQQTKDKHSGCAHNCKRVCASELVCAHNLHLTNIWQQLNIIRKQKVRFWSNIKCHKKWHRICNIHKSPLNYIVYWKAVHIVFVRKSISVCTHCKCFGLKPYFCIRLFLGSGLIIYSKYLSLNIDKVWCANFLNKHSFVCHSIVNALKKKRKKVEVDRLTWPD